MTAPDPALTARAETAWGEIAAERWPGDRPLTPAWFRTGFIAGALSEREVTDELRKQLALSDSAFSALTDSHAKQDAAHVDAKAEIARLRMALEEAQKR